MNAKIDHKYGPALNKYPWRASFTSWKEGSASV